MVPLVTQKLQKPHFEAFEEFTYSGIFVGKNFTGDRLSFAEDKRV
jgi:hypothetical protein